MLRQPVRTFAVVANSNYIGSGNSGTIQLPEFDFNSITYKVQFPGSSGAAPAVDFAMQTTDDGGTTWWDMFRLSLVTASTASGTAYWATVAADDNSRFIGKLVGTIAGNTIALPHLSRLIRGTWVIPTGNINIQVDAFLNTIQPH